MDVAGLNPDQAKATRQDDPLRGITQQKVDDLHILEAYRARPLPPQECENRNIRPKKNGAVCEDCAEPHETSNLTHPNQTRALRFRSNYAEEKGGPQIRIAGGSGLHPPRPGPGRTHEKLTGCLGSYARIQESNSK
jgi:hypothetical protein